MSPRWVIGNWKMHGTRGSARAFIEALRKYRRLAGEEITAKLVLCPPATMLREMHGWLSEDNGESLAALCGQDCHGVSQGAFTGEIAAPMLREAGCRYVLLGHSERRLQARQRNDEVAQRVLAAWRHDLEPVLCVGAGEEGAGWEDMARSVEAQLAESVPRGHGVGGALDVAYEPLWAIGTGRAASGPHIASMLARLRRLVGKLDVKAAPVRMLYGGSVDAGNAAEILSFPGVDGVLVGGASLDPEHYWRIATAASRCRAAS